MNKLQARLKKVCTPHIWIDPRKCKACGACIDACPCGVIGKAGFFLHRHIIFVNGDACTGCGKCAKSCGYGVFGTINQICTAHFWINIGRCAACWKCIKRCPKGVLGASGTGFRRHIIIENGDACTGCGLCRKACGHHRVFGDIGSFNLARP